METNWLGLQAREKQLLGEGDRKIKLLYGMPLVRFYFYKGSTTRERRQKNKIALWNVSSTFLLLQRIYLLTFPCGLTLRPTLPTNSGRVVRRGCQNEHTLPLWRIRSLLIYFFVTYQNQCTIDSTFQNGNLSLPYGERAQETRLFIILFSKL